MEPERFLTCLERDYGSLSTAVAGADPGARVPSCPDWTAADLAHHVAEVYRHKVECIRQGRFPDPWPPEPVDPDPVVDLEDAYMTLRKTFAAHEPGHSRPPSWMQIRRWASGSAGWPRRR